MTELKPPVVLGHLRAAASGNEFSAIRAELRRLDVDDAALRGLVAAVDERPESQARLLRLRSEILGPDADPRPFLLERYALLVAAVDRVAALATLHVPEDVVQLFLQEFEWLAGARGSELQRFEGGQHTFTAICKLVSLRRFPAGQVHWEVSGLPRSTFLRVKGLDRARLVGAVLRLGGFAPVVVPHMPWRRQLVLLERQQHLSLYRIAETMRRQTEIRGLIAEAWFHAPDTYKVSPHLAWVNRVFLEWGGVVVNSGPAGADSGVYERSEVRRRLAEEGKFEPSLGLVVWPRRAMLEWAAHYARDGLRAAG